MKKAFVNPAIRVIEYESAMLCDSGIQPHDCVPTNDNTENNFAPSRGAFGSDSSLF